MTDRSHSIHAIVDARKLPPVTETGPDASDAPQATYDGDTANVCPVCHAPLNDVGKCVADDAMCSYRREVI